MALESGIIGVSVTQWTHRKCGEKAHGNGIWQRRNLWHRIIMASAAKRGMASWQQRQRLAKAASWRRHQAGDNSALSRLIIIAGGGDANQLALLSSAALAWQRHIASSRSRLAHLALALRTLPPRSAAASPSACLTHASTLIALSFILLSFSHLLLLLSPLLPLYGTSLQYTIQIRPGSASPFCATHTLHTHTHWYSMQVVYPHAIHTHTYHTHTHGGTMLPFPPVPARHTTFPHTLCISSYTLCRSVEQFLFLFTCRHMCSL